MVYTVTIVDLNLNCECVKLLHNQCAAPLLVPPHRSPVICSARAGNNEMIQKSIKLRNTDQLATAHASFSFSYSDDEITGHYEPHLVIITVSTVCCSAALLLSAR